jgi:hypothetical protein
MSTEETGTDRIKPQLRAGRPLRGPATVATYVSTNPNCRAHVARYARSLVVLRR